LLGNALSGILVEGQKQPSWSLLEQDLTIGRLYATISMV